MTFGADPRLHAPPTATPASIAASDSGRILIRRWAATWIDWCVMAACLLVPDATLGNDTYRATLAVWLSLAVLYVPIMEWTLGKTLGKYALFIRVVNAAGDTPSLGQVSMRTLLRLVEVNPLFLGGIPAGVAVLMSKHRQRLGDMAAGTYVLRDKDLRALRKATVV